MEPRPSFPAEKLEKTFGLEEFDDLCTAALGLLDESSSISLQTREKIREIVSGKQWNRDADAESQKYYLLWQLSDYLTKKNPDIFAADKLIKNGHEIGKSAAIGELNLSEEDSALLEWYRQVRA